MIKLSNNPNQISDNIKDLNNINQNNITIPIMVNNNLNKIIKITDIITIKINQITKIIKEITIQLRI